MEKILENCRTISSSKGLCHGMALDKAQKEFPLIKGLFGWLDPKFCKSIGLDQYNHLNETGLSLSLLIFREPLL